MNKKRVNTFLEHKISKDCWSLDMAWLEWLKKRLPVYLKEAGEVINLDYHRIAYDGVDYTQREAIEKMIELVDYLTDEEIDDWSDDYMDASNRLCDLWKIWYRGLWW